MAAPRTLRIGLAFLAVSAAVVGIWGRIDPLGFYQHFPGLGRAWVVTDGPYNEHLVTDFAAAQLGFAVILAAASATLSVPLVRAALVGWIVYSVPHVVYHATNLSRTPETVDKVTSLGSLIFLAVLPVVLLLLTSHHAEASTAPAPVEAA